MSEIRVKDNESLDSALRRFKRSCARSGVLAEVRKREAYEKPSVRRKKKSKLPASASSNKNSGHAASKRTGGPLRPAFFAPKEGGGKGGPAAAVPAGHARPHGAQLIK